MITFIQQNLKSMNIRQVTEKDKKRFNELASHPLQSFEWGEFRKRTGVKIIRLGKYEKEELIEVLQITIHKIPFSNFHIGYVPKSRIPSNEMISELISYGKKLKCIFIKFEPNIEKTEYEILKNKVFSDGIFNFVHSQHPLFTLYTQILDLKHDENQLMASMHNKTRYNIRIAQKHNVRIVEDNSDHAFDEYLKLTGETVKRQEFHAHNRNYHQTMWGVLKEAGLAHLFTANFEENGKRNILVTWILFLFNNVLYYPYGASSNIYRNVMASNLMMWEAIKWGKKMGATSFDMWGSLGPDADSKDPWFGFHRFKLGYGTRLVEFIGSYDLVINPIIYNLYNLVYDLRSIILKTQAILRNKFNIQGI
jgi:lipid II:glycine glycyltransferase (peptidoglycan interpeptide bridge formation enzyme)